MDPSDTKLEEQYLLAGYSHLTITSIWLRVPKSGKDFTIYGKPTKTKDGAEICRAIKVLLNSSVRFV